jgi:hypothetical protein
MPCSSLCGYTDEMRRPHFSCLFCRVRRLFYGKMDSKRYHYNKIARLVFPQQCVTYVLLIDQERSFKRVKDALLKKLLTICELLAN